MTRQEEIDHVKMTYHKGLHYDPRICFKEGIEWADNHPKSSWISIKDDLPCNYPNNIHFGFTDRVLTTNGKINIFIALMKNINNEWVWYSDDNFDVSHVVTHWMPLPQPPKEYFEIK